MDLAYWRADSGPGQGRSRNLNSSSRTTFASSHSFLSSLTLLI